MSETDTSTDTVDTSADTAAADTTGADTWTPPDRSAWDKINADAKRRDTLLREAQAEIAKLRKGPASTDTAASSTDTTADTEPDTTDTLRTALRRTAASAVLSGRGVTDEKDQEAVLSVLHLDTLPVDEKGKVDTSALGDTLDSLARIFGAKSTDRRTPRVDTRAGSGDTGTAKSRDSNRYERIIRQGR